MHFLTGLSLLAALAETSSASPVKRTSNVDITFIGAANAQFSQSFPTDGSSVHISNPLSISHIANGNGNVQCTFNGIDHSVTTVTGVQTVDVGPPQTQTSGSCHKITNPGGQHVTVTFIGAADAEFTQSFPVNGGSVQITNVLSISHIEMNAAGVTCTFNGIDHSVTTLTGSQFVDVGPPQTQVSGTCKSF
ncbi:hypothetical protein N7488_009702 [Penicillium malachiteum]|nr:hypothetical protein N7488_009702 [Penicillium malachiteum]